jgi:hypothetical protein
MTYELYFFLLVSSENSPTHFSCGFIPKARQQCPNNFRTSPNKNVPTVWSSHTLLSIRDFRHTGSYTVIIHNLRTDILIINILQQCMRGPDSWHIFVWTGTKIVGALLSVTTRKGKNSISLCLNYFQFRLFARIVLDVRSILFTKKRYRKHNFSN